MPALVAPASAAEDCTLKQLAAVETTAATSGGMLVPVTMAGKQVKMLLDTGGYMSSVSPRVARELGLATRHVGIVQYDVAGKPIDQTVDVRDFRLGTLKASSLEFMVGEPPSGTDGVLAPNILQAYDVELDFPRKKLSLISPDHCKGQVVYWPNTAVAAVPMRITETGHIVFRMQLDDQRVQAMLDTATQRTTLSTSAASRLFNINASMPTYRFKTLSVEGITVNNPEIALASNITRAPTTRASGLLSSDERRDTPDLLLGMSTLKHLHVYIAYKERMLYITAGDSSGTRRPS